MNMLLTSLRRSRISPSVGFMPMALMVYPSSLELMLPPLSLGKFKTGLRLFRFPLDKDGSHFILCLSLRENVANLISPESCCDWVDLIRGVHLPPEDGEGGVGGDGLDQDHHTLLRRLGGEGADSHGPQPRGQRYRVFHIVCHKIMKDPDACGVIGLLSFTTMTFSCLHLKLSQRSASQLDVQETLDSGTN